VADDKRKRVRTRDVVADGLYIASAATRLRLKNAILVHILANGEDFDPDLYLGEARSALKSLAEEAGAMPRRASANARSPVPATPTRTARTTTAAVTCATSVGAEAALHVAPQLRLRAADDAELRS
jgi:hypothetical protein